MLSSQSYIHLKPLNLTMVLGHFLTNINVTSGFESFIYFVRYRLLTNLKTFLVVNVYSDFNDVFSMMSYHLDKYLGTLVSSFKSKNLCKRNFYFF